MKSLKEGRIKIFSSGKEMPIGRYSDFQKYLVQSIDINSLITTLNRSKAYCQEDRKEDCEIEIDNSIQAVLILNNGLSMQSYCFAILVAEIDGKQAKDTTIDGLDLIISQLNDIGLTQKDIEDSIEDVKKK